MSDLIRLLLVEDDDSAARMMASHLDGCSEFSVSLDRVSTLGDAIAATHDHSYDLVIVDLELPDCSGLANVTRLKEAAPSATIIVLTTECDEEGTLEAIRLGAQERICRRDLQSPQVLSVIRHSLARQQHLLTAQSQAMTDALTGIGNRRAFERELERRFNEHHRHGVPFSLTIFDIDHFKKINDRWGHDIGDKILRIVGENLYGEVRATDMVARIGGGIFGVIFVATHLAEALQVSHRVRGKIRETCGARIQDELQLTLSGGIAEVAAGDDIRSILNRADEALYVAKQSGRNCCMAHDGLNVSGQVAVPCLS
ncbi:diguanylate cyclase [Blastopirellula marina]|uniref:diguanylate cyclase n=1 Tax=Blastopirellula marina TaxID=124 RepID=A0A2S8GAK0_9BACT|nr:diguanylate cyclase [Blastopirellula marina]PQO41486.1 hypothetical protein C5Y93_30730 [Blastopirellula marina]